MKLIEIMLDDKVLISYRCQDEEVQPIADMFKHAKITDIVGDSVNKTRMDIFDIASPKPHPTDEPARKKGLKLVPFLNWN